MSEKRIIFVTGGTGFIGSALLSRLVLLSDYHIKALVRDQNSDLPLGVVPVFGDSLNPLIGPLLLDGVDIVIHCAAFIGDSDTASQDSNLFEQINIGGTRSLAHQALEAGVRRFIFISSIKVNGEVTLFDHSFLPSDIPAPEDEYGKSKHRAEQELQNLCKNGRMKYVIIRPPLVYGPSVKGNFMNLAIAILRGLPLPFGAVRNRRSLVYIENLIDLIVTCLDNPRAVNRTLLVSDGEDLSTPELIRKMAAACGKTVWLIPIPICFLKLVATILNKRSTSRRLLDSLQIDISTTCQLLHWKPPISVEEALRRTFLRYRKVK